jgi:predicted NBD/HSP70 family sugar kinase
MSAPVIGIDLRPSKVAVAPLRDGRLAESLVQPTERSEAAALIDQLAAMVESTRTDDLRGLGLACLGSWNSRPDASSPPRAPPQR